MYKINCVICTGDIANGQGELFKSKNYLPKNYYRQKTNSRRPLENSRAM